MVCKVSDTNEAIRSAYLTLEAISFVWRRFQVVRNASLFLNTLKTAWLFWIDEYFSDHATSQLSSVYWVGKVNSLYLGLRNTTHAVYSGTSEKQQPAMHVLCRAEMKWGSWNPKVNEDKEGQYRVTSLKASAMHILTLHRWSETGGNTNIRTARLMTRCYRKFFTRLIWVADFNNFEHHFSFSYVSLLFDDICMVFNPILAESLLTSQFYIFHH